MAEKYTKEQLNSMNQEDLVQAVMSMQDSLSAMQSNYEQLDHTMQLMLEELADAKRHRFGRSSEKLETNGQLTFPELDDMYAAFNEVEAVADLPEEPKKRGTKKQGKREADLKNLPVKEFHHEMTEEELSLEYPDEEYKRLPDEIQRRYYYKPAEIGVEEHHIAVYSGKESEHVVKAKHPRGLLRNSTVSPSLAAGIINAKYVNAVPLYRQETMYQNDGLAITRKNMADWMIKLADRYMSLVYERMHQQLMTCDVIQADETPVLVNKDGRDAGSKSYMWVYRSGQSETKRPVVLYEYQKTRNAQHPREFLKDYSGVCVTDGYQVYHTIEKERDNLVIAGCWAHARRKFDEALKALPKDKRKGCVANTALKMIQAIYTADKAFAEQPPEERLKQRQSVVQPLVEAYFAWLKENQAKVMSGTKTAKGIQYSLNQEQYLKSFLNHPDIPMDNNAAERAIRSFCVGKKNWMFIDTISGAKSSAIIYSIVETVKANHLKPYHYFDYMLSSFADHMDDLEARDYSFIDNLLPWSESIPKECRKATN